MHSDAPPDCLQSSTRTGSCSGSPQGRDRWRRPSRQASPALDSPSYVTKQAVTRRGAGRKDRAGRSGGRSDQRCEAAAPTSCARRDARPRLGWVQRLAHVHLGRTTPPPLRTRPRPFAARSWLDTGRMGAPPWMEIRSMGADAGAMRPRGTGRHAVRGSAPRRQRLVPRRGRLHTPERHPRGRSARPGPLTDSACLVPSSSSHAPVHRRIAVCCPKLPGHQGGHFGE